MLFWFLLAVRSNSVVREKCLLVGPGETGRGYEEASVLGRRAARTFAVRHFGVNAVITE